MSAVSSTVRSSSSIVRHSKPFLFLLRYAHPSTTLCFCIFLLLVMVFSFSFSLSVPGISNPFAAANPDPASSPNFHYDTDVQHSSVPRRRPPSPSLLPPLSKKRGWVPSSSEPSRPAPMHTSTSGYLDTPAKYRDMAYQSAEQDEVEEMVAGEYLNRNFLLHSGWASRLSVQMRLAILSSVDNDMLSSSSSHPS